MFVGVVLMSVEGMIGLGVVCRDVLFRVYFRVVRLHTAPLVCIL